MKNTSVEPVRGALHTALKGCISFEWALAIYEWLPHDIHDLIRME
jgi:hypothetical protein